MGIAEALPPNVFVIIARVALTDLSLAGMLFLLVTAAFSFWRRQGNIRRHVGFALCDHCFDFGYDKNIFVVTLISWRCPAWRRTSRRSRRGCSLKYSFQASEIEHTCNKHIRLPTGSSLSKSGFYPLWLVWLDNVHINFQQAPMNHAH